MVSKKELLENLKNEILLNLNCPLKKTAKNIVFGYGNPEAEIMLIGEAPGEQEDKQGIPFVGRAGKQLDIFLKKIDLNRENIYIANILKYRPPNNRNPTITEIKRHTPYLIKQISIINPKIIVTLGNYSSKFILSGFRTEKMNSLQGISNLRGRIFRIKINDLSFYVLPVYHPAATLYNPILRNDFEKDFLLLKRLIEKLKNKNKET